MGKTFLFFKQLSTNKGLEIQLTLKWKFGQWFKVSFETHTKCDHERVQFTFEMLKLVYFHVMVYDFRHWNYDKNTYCEPGEVSYH